MRLCEFSLFSQICGESTHNFYIETISEKSWRVGKPHNHLITVFPKEGSYKIVPSCDESIICVSGYAF